MPPRLTVKTLPSVVKRVMALDRATRTELLKRWNAAINDMAADDAWGTEGQLDPRGDARDDERIRGW